jgi:1-phosphatidylinositol-4-phosphate 5-kinase
VFLLETIHSRYDIKGSWVNRKGDLPKRGKKVTCRHCNRKYIFQSRSQTNLNDDHNKNCPLRLGGHEPNIVLKDSDLTEKLKLDKDVSWTLYQQLQADSELLCKFGIMDYSLLIGIHDVEFTVETEMKSEISGALVDATPSKSSVNDASDHRPPPRSGLRFANTVVGPAFYHLVMIESYICSI